MGKGHHSGGGDVTTTTDESVPALWEVLGFEQLHAAAAGATGSLTADIICMRI